MQWLIMTVGFAILFALTLAARRRPTLTRRDAPLENELPAYFTALAVRTEIRGSARLRLPHGTLRALEAHIGWLNRFPREELTSAGQWLSDNGRFLQEETASLSLALRNAPKLPAVRDGQPRVSLFASELIGHTNADLQTSRLMTALAAWQKSTPFTAAELNCLPLALRLALLRVLTELSALCREEQEARQAADGMARLVRAGREKAVKRVLTQYAQSAAFLEHLLSRLNEHGDAERAAWLEQAVGSAVQMNERLARTEHDRQTENGMWVGNAVTSLRTAGRMPWERLLEDASLTHAALLDDETYAHMDMESRAYYRARVAALAQESAKPEKAVCTAAFALCQTASAPNDAVRAHIGFYLLDEGQQQLLRCLQADGPRGRIRLFAQTHACGLYRAASWLMFAALLALGVWLSFPLPALLPFSMVFLFAAQRMLMWLCARRIPPRLVPRIQLEALGAENRTLVICPTLLTGPEHALQMAKQLSIHYRANPDPDLHFLLLGDYRDSLTGTLANDGEIVQTAAAAISALAQDTDHPFYYMQRARVYHASDHLYMSRERKRGGVETLLRLLDGRAVEESFDFASVLPESLKGRYRFVITLDADTILPPGAALRMAGAMLHPLQQRREFEGRMRGVSILQPRMETAAHTVESTLSLLLGGRGGTDPYNAPTSDFYQDACGRGSFVGKGIISPSDFLDATEGKILPGCVLSHDLLEGELAGCAAASDITLYDGHPKNLKGFMYRLHRWTRGDWQLLTYLLPGLFRGAPKGVLDSVARHKLWQNLFRSLIQPLRLLLCLYAAGARRPWLLLCALLLPELASLLPFTYAALTSLCCRLAALPCEAVMQADAIGRTLYRLLFSRRNLLQWTTAQQMTLPSAKPPMLFFYASMGASALMVLTSIFGGIVMPLGLATAALWAALPFAMPRLEQPVTQTRRPTGYMREVLDKLANETLSFFDTAITDEDNALPPDNLQLDPDKGVSHRTSPTNIGLYMLSLLAAERLRALSPDDAAQRLLAALVSVEKLPKWQGHLYNWYDTRTLAPLQPLFVSSVDSGNLAACLLTCAQGMRALAPELSRQYRSIPARLDELVQHMRFGPLYDPDAELFYIGLHPEQPGMRPAHYDLLASEARLLSFVAIMLGHVPVRHWYRLGRVYARAKGGRTLMSFSGTMFEYMMPLLFQPLTRGTLIYDACRAAFREQRAHRLYGVFGVSESAYFAFDPSLYYQYKAFGLSSLSLNPARSQDVISPYATLLALPVAPDAAFANLLKLQSLGMEGPMGMFEAIDFAKERVGDQPFRIIRSHMAHHQGMILCAICNTLCDGYIARLFSELPRARAYRLLLEEKPPCGQPLIRRPLKSTAGAATVSPLYAEREASPLCFPIDAHILHGGETSLLADAQGGGYLSRKGVMATRFHESCELPSGIRFYLRDVSSGAYWCVTDPALTRTVSFQTAQAVFTHQRMHVETTLRAFVNPLDGTALHCLTLQNTLGVERLMEVCSYLEPALCGQREYMSHPAFQNLFIQTELLGRFGVCARRRPRAQGEQSRSLWHLLTTDASPTSFHVQTDRAAFLGRGRTVYAPRALEAGASQDALGAMIDPCLSLRAQFLLPADGSARFVFATALPDADDTPAAFAERYGSPDTALRCYESALTQGLVTARYLNLSAQEQNAISRLCGSLCYVGQPAQARYAEANTRPLNALWELGISGDLPIMLMECESAEELTLAELLMKAHAFMRMSGLWTELVLLYSAEKGPELSDALSELMHASPSREMIGKEGGVRLLFKERLSIGMPELLRAAARVVLGAGTLHAQLNGSLLSVRGKPIYACKPSAAWKTALPAGEDLLYANGYGGFSPTDGNYVITLPSGVQTPAPWCNPLCSEALGTYASESGPVFSYVGNSQTGLVTRWPNDGVTPRGGERFFMRDTENKLLWSVTRYPLGHGMPSRVTHAPGETLYETSGYGVYARLVCFTDIDAPILARALTLRNDDERERVVTYIHAFTFQCGSRPAGWQLTWLWREGGAVYARLSDGGMACLRGIDPEATETASASAGAFDGLWSVAPFALTGAEALPTEPGNAAALSFAVRLKPGESKTIISAIGFGTAREEIDKALTRFRTDGATLRLYRVKQSWEKRLCGLRFELPDAGLALMLNRWLPYQVRAARLTARAGFYQASGAYGFRDQLQDVLSLTHTEPDVAREHILRCAAHQFEEGDVQHWWHPPRFGVRTRITDDMLFLPFVTAIYVRVTGDSQALHEPVPYLHAAPLDEGENERVETPEVSALIEPLSAHCLRAIDRMRFGARGLPLMGGGDWNDGMNLVGGENGESVWLGMFACEVLRLFMPLCEPTAAQRLGERRLALLQALEHSAWDGAWYLRAWYSDGARLGSSSSSECRIDLLPQCWAVLCGLSRERAAMAMDQVWNELYDRELGVLKLFAPPFDGLEKPGYIAGYLPGVRENGGQYSHAVPWAIAAYHQLGQEGRAWELAAAMLPVCHTGTKALADRYRAEPYAMAGDIYISPNQRGRGGWTWYTGSASWYQFVVLEQLFGFQKVGGTLRFKPVAPARWESFRISYQYGSATYHLHASRECPFPMADGVQLSEGTLTLTDDGRIHEATFPLR